MIFPCVLEIAPSVCDNRTRSEPVSYGDERFLFSSETQRSTNTIRLKMIIDLCASLEFYLPFSVLLAIIILMFI